VAEPLLGHNARSNVIRWMPSAVEDVAVRPGCAEASSFIHAFKRWQGVTPVAFLRRST
jgi:AraC-like DNA-binding protein